jgi:hypothetical protein
LQAICPSDVYEQIVGSGIANVAKRNCHVVALTRTELEDLVTRPRPSVDGPSQVDFRPATELNGSVAHAHGSSNRADCPDDCRSIEDRPHSTQPRYTAPRDRGRARSTFISDGRRYTPIGWP